LDPQLYEKFRTLWSSDTSTFQVFRSLADPIQRVSVGAALTDTARHDHWAAALDAATTLFDPCAA